MMKDRLGKRGIGNWRRKVLVFVCTVLITTPAIAQQVSATPRDQLMLVTLKQLREGEKAVKGARENAIKETIQELQLSAAQEKLQKEYREYSKKTPGSGITVQAHPYISQSTSYWDQKDPKNDRHHVMIFNQSPGLFLSFLGKDKFVNLGFSVSDSRDCDRSDNRDDSAQVNLASNFVFNKYTFSVTDNYFNNYIAGPDIGIDPKIFNYYWQNDLSTSLSSRFNRLGFSLGYQRTDVNYRISSGLVPDTDADNDGQLVAPSGTSSSVDVFSLSSDLKIAPKTTLSFGYNYGMNNYLERVSVDGNSGNSYYNTYSTSIAGVLSPKVTATVGANYTLTHYRSTAANETKSLGIPFGLSYAISDRTDLALTYSYTHHFEGNAANYYHDGVFGISGNHRLAFNPKLKFSFACKWDSAVNDKLATPTQIKKTRNFSVGLNYAFRQWLDFGLSYAYRRYDYNYNDDDYGKHNVRFSTNARF